MTTKLKATDVILDELPRAVTFQVLVKGPETYCAGLRTGQSLTLTAKDGDIDVTLASPVAIGPLANFINTQHLGMTTHYANKQGRDPLGMFHSLEALYPTDRAAAVDPRTIYSCLTLEAIPYPTTPIIPTA